MRRNILILVFTLFAVLATSCGSTADVEIDPNPDNALADRLHTAQERWDASELTDYVVKWSPTCFCPDVTFIDTVVAGQVSSHKADGETFFETTGMTMADLLSEIQLALDDDPFHIEAEFDQETGAVISYWVDIEEMMADEEHGVVVHSVTPTDSVG